MSTPLVVRRGRARAPAPGSGPAALLALLVLASPVGVGAQEGADPGGVRAGCFRGRPLPTCSTFWLAELQGLAVVAEDERTLVRGNLPPLSEGVFESRVELTVGHMVNLGRDWAVGGGISLGTGAADPWTGARARVRRWLGSDMAVELQSGLVRTEPGHGRSGTVEGFSADLRLNIQDRGAVVVRYDLVDLEPAELASGLTDPGGRLGALSVGAAAGSLPALVGSGLLGVMAVALIGTVLMVGG